MQTFDTIQLVATSTVAGALFGSYANVVAWRRSASKQCWRERLRDLSRRSACPSCNRTLDWIELIPVFGWVLVSGTCRTCKVAVSPAYMLTEAVVAIASGLLAFLLPLAILLPALALTWMLAPMLARGMFVLLPAPTKNPLHDLQGVDGGTSVGTSTNQLQNENKHGLSNNEDRLEHGSN